MALFSARLARGLARAGGAALTLALAACSVVPINPDLAPPGYAQEPRPGDSRPTVGLVLGSGASRGFAHIGVIQVLEEHGIVPDVVVGTSAGSLVGALYAGGKNGAALEKIAHQMSDEDVRDFMFPDRGFVRGNALQAFVNRQLGNRSIEQLQKPFAAVATDLQDGVPAVFNRGNVGIAVRASSSIPGVYQPVRIGKKDYVDGGLVSPVPIDTARKLGARVVIAVDVSRKPDRKSLMESIVEILDQTIAIMGRYIAARESGHADVLIEPEVEAVGRFDFDQVDLAITAGRDAAIEALPRITEALRAVGAR